jgi:hypothetical protein
MAENDNRFDPHLSTLLHSAPDKSRPDPLPLLQRSDGQWREAHRAERYTPTRHG